MSTVHFCHYARSTLIPYLRDDHYYRTQLERSQILSEIETLQKVYEALLDEHRTLQTNYDDVVAEKEDALNRLRARREVNDKRSEKADGALRVEVERLRGEVCVQSFAVKPF